MHLSPESPPPTFLPAAPPGKWLSGSEQKGGISIKAQCRVAAIFSLSFSSRPAIKRRPSTAFNRGSGIVAAAVRLHLQTVGVV